MLPRLLLLLGLACACFAQSPVYLLLWFDTEDYVDPASDDAALRIADDLTKLGVRATFKIVGEKARVLESRGRTDVIRALARHGVGYHTNYHSIQPAPAVYLRRYGFLEGAAEFERREAQGIADLRRIFGVTPFCYGQPGSSWGPQSNPALRRLGVPMYLDEGSQVAVDEQPFWYGGIFHIFGMGRHRIRLDFDNPDRNATVLKQFDSVTEALSRNGGGTLSSYAHPTEFINSEFWDGANFPRGASRERSQWQMPKRRSKAEAERSFQILHDFVVHALKNPKIRFITAQDAMQLYRPVLPPAIDRAKAAAHLANGIGALHTSDGDWSAADLLLTLLNLPAQVVDGPTTRAASTYGKPTIERWLWEQAKKDAAGFIRRHHRLPSEVFVGSETLSLPDFTATLAGDSSSGDVRVARGRVTFEKYFATDAAKSFDWAIHPTGFAAPELLEMGRLQGWTLKPARLR